MAGAPTLQLLLDNGTGTFPHDISSRIRKVDGWDISNRGRTDEQTEATAGQLTITLNNKDGALTPGSTVIASPSPVVADQLVRLKLTVGATTVNRFTGRLQGNINSWPGGKALALVTITVVDDQAVLERRTLKSYVEEETARLGPDAYYTLGEPAGATSAADSSGNQAPALTMAGSGTDVVFGNATGPGTDGLTAAEFAGGKYLKNSVSYNLDSASSVSFLIAFNTSTAGSQLIVGDGLTANTQFIGMNAGSKLSAQLAPPGGAAAGVTSSAAVDDGLTHTAIVTLSGGTLTLYLDGASEGSAAFTSGAPTWALGFAFTGALSHACVFPGVLSAQQAADLDSAIRTGFAGESGTDRLTRLAGYADVPIGTLDASLTNVAFKDITGQSAADAIRDAAAAELGIAYIDGSGSLVFHNRNRVPVKTAPDITIPAEALSPGTTVPTDMQGIVNYLETSSEATGVTQVVWDKVSELGDGTATHPGHGRYPDQVSYLVQTDAEALDRGNWIVSNHAEPQARVGTLEIDVFAQTSAIQQALLAAEPDTWIRVTGLPSQMPGGTTADLIVQGWSEKGSTTEWKLTANVVSRSLYAPVWILGDPTYSVLGSTTRLYV